MQEHMTADQFRKLEIKKPSKYHNKKCECEGITFDSISEKDRYVALRAMHFSGEINGFKRQPSFLFDNGIRYRPDFIVFGHCGEIWVEDVKGMLTPEFKLKQKMWEHEYPWIELRIIK